MPLPRIAMLFFSALFAFLSLSALSAAQENQTRIYTTRDGLAGDYITAIQLARDGSAWIGTTEGATHIEPNRWTSYTRVHGLGDSWITAIAIAPDERVWFGTQSGGVSVLDPKTKTFTTYNLDNSEIPSNFVKAIAVDQNNRVWIDTLDKGVGEYDIPQNKWTRADTPMPRAPAAPDTWRATPRGLVVTNPPAWLNPPKPYPTVLIHGWTVAGDDTLETSEFRFLKSYADRDGIPMYYVRSVSPKNTLYQNAQIIRDEIARVKKETGAGKVNIIGFSMGGMNTRAYLETSLYANDVNHAIILGTPQAGVEIWKPILFQQILQKADEPSTIELSPEYAQMVVNQTRAPNPNVTYDLLIGDARAQAGLEFIQDMPASDALISVNSSLALDAPTVNKHVNADLHDWGPQAVPLELTSYLYPRDTWERYLRNALRNNDNAPIGSEIAEAAVPPAEAWVSNHTPVVTEKIRAGETVTRTVLIDENNSARFIAYFPGGKINFSLVAPDGKRYEPSDLPREDETGILSLSTDLASFSGYAVKGAPVGEWKLILERTDSGSDALDVSTYVELEAPRQMESFMRFGNIVVGRPNHFSAWVSGTAPDTISHPTKMSVLIAEPSEQANKSFTFTELELIDDGQHDDGSANDGYFANTFTPTRAGWHLVFFQTVGQGFARAAETMFVANENDAHLKTPVTLTRTGNSWTLEPNAQLARAGKYLLSALVINTETNKVVTQALVPFTAQAGAHVLSVSLPIQKQLARCVLDLTLLDADGAAYRLDHITEPCPKNSP